MAVSFFCTRCRTLLEYPDESCGSIIYCPRCQQAIIVPMLVVNVPENPFRADEPLNVYQSQPGKVRSNAGNSTDIPIIRHLDESLGVHTLGHSLGIGPIESIVTEMEDSEFLQRLRPDTGVSRIPKKAHSSSLPSNVRDNSFATPISSPSVMPVFSHAIDESDASEDRDTGGFRDYFFVGILAAIFVLGLGGWGSYYFLLPKKNDAEPSAVATSKISIPIDGLVVYVDANNRLQGDEGALVFLFPPNYPTTEPFVTKSLSSTRPTPAAFQSIHDQLQQRGARFTRVASDGLFDVRIETPGKYKILIVSAHVRRNSTNSDANKVKDIAKYIFDPEQSLLPDHAFYWGEQQLDDSNFRIEYKF